MMKILLLAALCSLAAPLWAQSIRPTATEALFELKVESARTRKALQVEVRAVAAGTQTAYEGKTDQYGKLYLMLPIGHQYQIFVNEGLFAEVEVPNQPNVHFLQTFQLTDDDLWAPTQETAIVKLQVETAERQPIREALELVSVTTSEVYAVQLDDYGGAYVRLPIADQYLINFETAPRYDRIVLPDQAYYKLRYKITYRGSEPDYKYPSLEQALINITFWDLDGYKVPGELMQVTDNKTGEVYEELTSKKGLAQFLVPVGGEYSLSARYNQNFHRFSIPAEEASYTYDFTFESLSSADWEARLAERERLLKAREARYKAGTWAFPERDTVVAAVFSRHTNWVNKLVVSDVTGSMSPYVDQLRLWYALAYEEADPIQFVFFNDGDKTPDEQKVIGSTGGLYYCNYCSPEELYAGMSVAMAAGYGGDGPENDLEALIAAVAGSQDYTHLILIADNYSDVRDIALLDQVSDPVKVIVCGAEGWIHEDYLNIAYRTGGSVHTIEEDIIELSKKVDGERITIGRNQYILKNGSWIRLD